MSPNQPGPFFSLRNLTHAYLCDGFKITAYTDVPCHLWMRWSNNPPQLHDMPVLRRGLFMHGDRYFCFTAYRDNEQEELGDTTVHTFIKRNWDVCESRWFYFYGRVSADWCKSTTPPFYLHFNIVHQVYPDTPSNRTLAKADPNWTTCHDAPSGTILTNYTPPYALIFAGNYKTVRHWIYRGVLFFDTTLLDPAIEYEEGYLEIYVHTVYHTASIAKPYIYITEGVQSDPVIITNYGDQLPYTAIGGQIDLWDIIVGQYNTIPLNSTGKSWIVPGGITRFCLRSQMDVDDTPPPTGANQVYFHSHQAGDAFKPKLTLCLPP